MAVPKESTVRKLFAQSMNRCSFPGCNTPIIDSETNTITAEICHICAQNSGGPRYDEFQSDEARHAAENLILMCSVHHKIIDARENLGTYTPDYLRELKAQHEGNSNQPQSAILELSNAQVTALQNTIENNFTAHTHMDFRGASFKAGGDGGHLGGAGGNGGVINIVGVSPSGFPEKIDANGQEGSNPGGGGGGGGVVEFSGRAGDKQDLQNGLMVSSLFIANALEASKNGLFSTLGGGWAYYDTTALDVNFRINVQCVFELGEIAAGTLLRIDYSVLRPNGDVAFKNHFELPVDATNAKINRCSRSFHPVFDANEFGIWKIKLGTGQIELATHAFEIRQQIG